MANVALETVSCRFGDLAAVDRLSLNIADGEFVVLLGPTGAGKTTSAWSPAIRSAKYCSG